MDQRDQLNSVIVNINMDATEVDPRFVVEEVTAQSGRCFEGAENLHRARFQCLGCTAGYVVLPLIMQTAPIRTEIETSIAEDDPTPNKKVAEYFSEKETGSTVDEVRQDQVVDSGKEQTQGDGLEDSAMEADMIFSKNVMDSNFVETTAVKRYHTDVVQPSDPKESKILTSSEELYRKLRSETVIGLALVDDEARKEDAPVAQIGPQERNVEDFYQCNICKAFIKSRNGLVQHLNTHMGIRFSCSDCPKSFSDKSHLSRHKKRFHQSEFRICEVCRRSKTCTKAEYYSHLRRQHPEHHIKEFQPKVKDFNGVDFSCVYCEPQVTFKSFDELKDHLGVTHGRKFACTRCPKAFNLKCDFKHHIKSVHQKKTFMCPKCSKIFVWKRSLRSHLHTHK